MNSGTLLFMIALFWVFGMSGCSTLQSIFPSSASQEEPKLIENPFSQYDQNAKNKVPSPVVLRTKKGDRSIEVEFPGDQNEVGNLVLPMSPAFKDASRGPAFLGGRLGQDDQGLDETYKSHQPSLSDREITSTFAHGAEEDESKRREIEEGLGLVPAEIDTPEQAQSYLAGIDKIKQLYRMRRYEAALLESDDMVKLYQTDARLYEMRGTLFERLGKPDLAMKSWQQSLRFNPKNERLKRFIERREKLGGGR